jgi:hypothetical protein
MTQRCSHPFFIPFLSSVRAFRPASLPLVGLPRHPRGRVAPVCLGVALVLALGLPAASAQEPKKTPAQPTPSPSLSANPNSPVLTNASTSAAGATNWQPLFDGKTLTGWKITEFAGHGAVKVEGGRLILESGVLTGITWSNELPRMNYEVSLDAMRVDGSDFFCALTFPVELEPCSFIVGGWGGGVVGLSSIDNEDAAHNETTSYLNFENGKWFKIRVRVTKSRIEAWIDGDQVVNLETKGRVISIRPEVELSKPLGIASWSTTAALRNIQIRKLTPSTP